MSASDIQQAIAMVMRGQDVDRHMSQQVMHTIMRGEATDGQIGAWLACLKLKGETADELIGAAEAMRQHVTPIITDGQPLLDTCGTGGDGLHTFNISTATAIVAAAAGVRVAKHGNRAVSSRCGSADVLEALGVHIQLDAQQAYACLQRAGICFLFAPHHHPAMKHVAAVRKQLGVRTMFNALGPLTNPAGAQFHVLGVYDRTMVVKVATVLQALGTKRALVVHSADGMDEISVSAPTCVAELASGDIKTYEVTPSFLGLVTSDVHALVGGDALHNAAIILRVLEGEKSPCRDIVVANAGACLYVYGQCATWQAGVQQAMATIDSGSAHQKLQQLISVTKELTHVS